jgi:hypothetical protein
MTKAERFMLPMIGNIHVALTGMKKALTSLPASPRLYRESI